MKKLYSNNLQIYILIKFTWLLFVVSKLRTSSTIVGKSTEALLSYFTWFKYTHSNILDRKLHLYWNRKNTPSKFGRVATTQFRCCLQTLAMKYPSWKILGLILFHSAVSLQLPYLNIHLGRLKTNTNKTHFRMTFLLTKNA